MLRGPQERQGLAAVEAIFVGDLSEREGFALGGLKEDIAAIRDIEGGSDWRDLKRTGSIAERARVRS